ncbi:hypothetical protein GPECTOR_23g153 [Gonium pectorale]|uniref:J domain-containing protein n=1 Tax=Gonium pectorale TaxID=33097 RepID=A0A150GGU9_GONPE|nr:hypothetical protein GPECTOR_23g153 [Gonium pectorale]|eukprot:KXZ49068.1 hypothetical protein GPECTOR_23g153 [Gonium pectorale]
MRVGFNRWVTRLNPATRRVEGRWETEWHTVAPDWRWSRRWGSETSEAQVYGGAKYRHDPALDRLRPTEHVRRALPYHEYAAAADSAARAAAAGGGGGGGAVVAPDRMYPFRLGPSEAAELARQRIRSAELRQAETALRESFQAASVRLVVMEVALQRLAATPVFVPVHVFKTRIRGTAMRTYVAGFTPGLTSGPVLPNPGRVAALAAAAGPVALLAGGVLAGAGWQAALWLGAVLPGVLGYGVASFWPELHAGALRLRARLQSPLPASAGPEQEEAWWRAEWVRQDFDDGYSFGADGRYSHSYRTTGPGGDQAGKEAGRSGGPGPGGPRDPKGYYRTLGVSPDSSTEEVQAAFRAAALRWHPDRQPDPAAKADSTRRFQAAQEAYSVLRDPARRAAYDRA